MATSTRRLLGPHGPHSCSRDRRGSEAHLRIQRHLELSVDVILRLHAPGRDVAPVTAARESVCELRREIIAGAVSRACPPQAQGSSVCGTRAHKPHDPAGEDTQNVAEAASTVHGGRALVLGASRGRRPLGVQWLEHQLARLRSSTRGHVRADGDCASAVQATYTASDPETRAEAPRVARAGKHLRWTEDWRWGKSKPEGVRLHRVARAPLLARV